MACVGAGSFAECRSGFPVPDEKGIVLMIDFFNVDVVNNRTPTFPLFL